MAGTNLMSYFHLKSKPTMPLLSPKSVEVAALILHIVYVLCIIVALASFFLHKCGLDLSNAECH